MPEDITAGADELLAVWNQFLTKDRIRHSGTMHSPPTSFQEEFW